MPASILEAFEKKLEEQPEVQEAIGDQLNIEISEVVFNWMRSQMVDAMKVTAEQVSQAIKSENSAEIAVIQRFFKLVWEVLDTAITRMTVGKYQQAVTDEDIAQLKSDFLHGMSFFQQTGLIPDGKNDIVYDLETMVDNPVDSEFAQGAMEMWQGLQAQRNSL